MPSETNYVCACCGGTFISDWSDEEAEAEYRQVFRDSAARNVPRSVVCDDCFKQMTTEYPPSEFERASSPFPERPE